MRNKFQTIKRFFTKSYSEDDLKNLFIWFNSEKGEKEIDDLLNKSWDLFKFDDNIDVDSQKLINNIKKRIVSKQPTVFRQAVKHLLPYAAVLIIAFLTAYLFFIIQKNEPVKSESNNISYTTIMTENAQRSVVVLPDSSIVWLNSGTTLSYPDNFSVNNRKVMLEGQAFFQVNHDENSTFSVQSDGFVVTVLGTKFDVNAYPENGRIDVVLELGKVKLTHMGFESFNYIMNEPGEMATFNKKDNSLNLSNANTKVYSSWKDGKLIFRNTPMDVVINKLEKWYNINVEVKDEEVYNSIFTGTIQNESYEQIFRLIEFASPVRCKIMHNYESDSLPEIIISKK